MQWTIPGIPPSNNRFIGKNHRWDYQAAKKKWMEAVALACTPRPEKPIESATVHFHYRFPNRIRRDPDNYSGKFLLDGLTHAGILADDSFNNVRLELSAEFGCNRCETVITVEEVRQ